MHKIFIGFAALFLIAHAISAHAASSSDVASIKAGFLIVNLKASSEINGIESFVIKLNEIESIVYYDNTNKASNKGTQSRIHIKLNNKDEHLQSQKDYFLEFIHPEQADTVYGAIVSAISDD